MSADERHLQLGQLLEEARLAGNQDKIAEIEADLANEFPNETQLGDSEPIT
jgi:hypothetical protein